MCCKQAVQDPIVQDKALYKEIIDIPEGPYVPDPKKRAISACLKVFTETSLKSLAARQLNASVEVTSCVFNLPLKPSPGPDDSALHFVLARPRYSLPYHLIQKQFAVKNSLKDRESGLDEIKHHIYNSAIDSPDSYVEERFLEFKKTLCHGRNNSIDYSTNFCQSETVSISVLACIQVLNVEFITREELMAFKVQAQEKCTILREDLLWAQDKLVRLREFALSENLEKSRTHYREMMDTKFRYAPHGSSEYTQYSTVAAHFLKEAGDHQYIRQHIDSLELWCVELEKQKKYLNYMVKKVEECEKKMVFQGTRFVADSYHVA